MQVNRLTPAQLAEVEVSLASDPRKAAMWGLSFYAAMRAGEISAVTWRAVINSEGEIGNELRIRPGIAKKKSGRNIPIVPELAAILNAWRSATTQPGLDDLIITPAASRPAIHKGNRTEAQQRADAVRKELTRVYEGLGFVGCGSHTGRRTRLTGLRKAGVPVEAVARFAGHKSLASTLAYTSYDDADMAAAIMSVPARA